MQKTCRLCSGKFEVGADDLAFLAKFTPVLGKGTINIPPPTICPECRYLRRLSLNNETNLYHRRCDFTNEPIISTVSPDKPYKIYKMASWWGHDWDPMEYGRAFDFSRPFFEQFNELCLDVPHAALHTNYLLDENSEYTNYAGSNKNCYLIFHADLNRDCYYGYGVKKCESCVDVFNVFDSELCYECVECRNCYNLRFSQDCVDCYDSAFLKNCIGCKNCLGCKNLQQKEYYILNKKYPKGEYNRLLLNYQLHSQSGLDRFKAEFEHMCEGLPNRFLQMIQTEDSVGDYLHNCRNVKWSYNVSAMHDGRYCYQVYNGAKDCMDLNQFGLESELVYEGSIIGYNAQRILFSHLCSEQVSDLIYCQECHHTSYLFSCIGLRQKRHCILNKQYSRDEYESLVKKIIAHMIETGEWGEFFPSAISMFGYNETSAMDYAPLTKDRAIRAGFKWHDERDTGAYVGPEFELPDSIEQVTEEITQKVLTCEASGKLYKIIPPELQFHQTARLPLPRRAPDERYRDRLRRRNPRQLRTTICGICNTSIYTSQPADVPNQVLCEACFLEGLG